MHEDIQNNRSQRKALLAGTIANTFERNNAILNIIQNGGFKDIQITWAASEDPLMRSRALTAEDLARIVHPETLATALHYVAELHLLEYIQNGITAAQLAKAKTPDGTTALHWAARGKSYKHVNDAHNHVVGVTAKELIQCTGPHGETALHWAAEARALDQVAGGLTFSNLVCNPDSTGRYPLHHAALHGDIQLLKTKATAEQLLQYRDRAGESALANAARGSNLKHLAPLSPKSRATVTATQLLAAGNVDTQTERTPLHHALHQEPECVTGLTATQIKPYTAANTELLIHAAHKNHHQTLRIILQTGINPANTRIHKNAATPKSPQPDEETISLIEYIDSSREPTPPGYGYQKSKAVADRMTMQILMDSSHTMAKTDIKQLTNIFEKHVQPAALAVWITRELSSALCNKIQPAR